MKKTIALTLAFMVVAGTVRAQTNAQIFKTVETLTFDKDYRQLLSYIKENPYKKITGDSLAWVQLRHARAFMATGRYESAKNISGDLYTRYPDINRSELSLKIHMLHALVLKKNAHYPEAAETYRHILISIPPDDYAKKAVATINYANTHWELGNFQTYADYTQKALTYATAHGDTRRQVLARQNLIEYHEKITGNWRLAAAHLDTLARQAISSGDYQNQAWYMMRRAIYERDKLDNPEEAADLLSQVVTIADKEGIFQIWEQAAFHLLHTYYLDNRLKESGKLLQQMKTNPVVKDIPWVAHKIHARHAQYYIMGGEFKKAKKELGHVIESRPKINDLEALAVGYHAEIMYHLKTGSVRQARQIVEAQLDMVLKNSSNITEGDGLAGKILYILSREKYSSDAPLTMQQVKEKIIEQYLDQKINDWVYEQSRNRHILPLGILAALTILGGFAALKKRWANSAQYRQLRKAIEAV